MSEKEKTAIEVKLCASEKTKKKITIKVIELIAKENIT